MIWNRIFIPPNNKISNITRGNCFSELYERFINNWRILLALLLAKSVPSPATGNTAFLIAFISISP
jgi:hypothetical protein